MGRVTSWAPREGGGADFSKVRVRGHSLGRRDQQCRDHLVADPSLNGSRTQEGGPLPVCVGSQLVLGRVASWPVLLLLLLIAAPSYR